MNTPLFFFARMLEGLDSPGIEPTLSRTFADDDVVEIMLMLLNMFAESLSIPAVLRRAFSQDLFSHVLEWTVDS